ncbi:NAD(P)-binding domain-containing protein [Streptomyces pyxinae]|uniref:NAD(P)-binding domain-containing protein n=1 Tax=Streptomyces pyxinae TaxID=2970734 RepID=UPI0028682D6C|nr:NAD(P)-binding domain-containing protein [Streptomyces sp. LP05-1]
MQKKHTSPEVHELLIVGAGPYGLSVAAHAAARGVEARVLGPVMSAWHAMPTGMLLKSEPWASDLSDPAGAYGLAAYAATRRSPVRHGEPVPVNFFAEYGDWFARKAVPAVDERLVVAVRRHPDGFEAETEDGETLVARTVVLAVGVLPFTEIPAPLAALGPDRVTHSSHHTELGRFAGRDVTVVGAGQAALETAVLLTEAGARARVLARTPRLRWNTLPPALHRGPWETARAPHTGLGAGWQNWFYARTPGLFRRLPAEARERLFDTALGPAGAWWLRHRFEAVPDVRLGRRVLAAEPAGAGVRLTVAGPAGPAAEVETDHVIAATGFAPRLDRVTVLDPELRAGLRTLGPGGAPEVGPLFESSEPGLFLAGLLTAPSFGPAMRFVYGAGYTAERLARGVARRLRTRPAPTPPRPRTPEPAPAPGRAAGTAPASGTAGAPRGAVAGGVAEPPATTSGPPATTSGPTAGQPAPTAGRAPETATGSPVPVGEVPAPAGGAAAREVPAPAGEAAAGEVPAPAGGAAAREVPAPGREAAAVKSVSGTPGPTAGEVPGPSTEVAEAEAADAGGAHGGRRP